MGAVEVEQEFSGNLEKSGAGQLKEHDSVIDLLEETQDVLGPLAMGCVT